MTVRAIGPGYITRWNFLWRAPRLFSFFWWPIAHPIFAFKRWMWSRCAWCGGRFAFLNFPSFDGFEDDPANTGPRWFRSEERLYHNRCYTEMKRPQWEAAERELGE